MQLYLGLPWKIKSDFTWQYYCYWWGLHSAHSAKSYSTSNYSFPRMDSKGKVKPQKKERPQHGNGHKGQNGQCQGPLTPSPYPQTLFQHPPSPFNHCFHLLYQRIQILQVIPRTWPLTNIQLIFSVPINWLCAKMPSFDKNKTVYIPCY